MARTYHSEPVAALMSAREAREALRNAAIVLGEAGCKSGLRSIAGVVRRADKAIRRRKTRLLDQYAERY